MLAALRTLIAETRGSNDLADVLSDLTPAERRAIVVAISDMHCIACGSDECDCSAAVDEAKAIVVRRAAELG